MNRRAVGAPTSAAESLCFHCWDSALGKALGGEGEGGEGGESGESGESCPRSSSC